MLVELVILGAFGKMWSASQYLRKQGKGSLHAITQPLLTLRTHFRLHWIKFFLRRDPNFLIHGTNTVHIFEVSFLEPIVHILLNDVKWEACIRVCFCIHRWRLRYYMRHLFAALRVKDMYVDKPALRCIPPIWGVDIFDNILDQFSASSKTHDCKIRGFDVHDP